MLLNIKSKFIVSLAGGASSDAITKRQTKWSKPDDLVLFYPLRKGIYEQTHNLPNQTYNEYFW